MSRIRNALQTCFLRVVNQRKLKINVVVHVTSATDYSYKMVIYYMEPWEFQNVKGHKPDPYHSAPISAAKQGSLTIVGEAA